MRCTPEALAAALRELDARSLRRRRVTVAQRVGATGARVVVDGRPCANFCSNDYLGLGTSAEAAEAMAACARAQGSGAGASHLVTGHGPEHEALERELAQFTGRERALLFSTGYMANLGVATALVDRGDLVLGDRLNHASLIDAALLPPGAQARRYAHGDAQAAHDALARFASEHPAAGAFVLTDGLFSMDGDLAPLPALARAARAHGATLVVDDAHGLGVLGGEGRGSCEHFGLGSADVPVLVGTLGKALGSFGAFVAGDATLIDWLVQRARTYVYTTALPQPVAAATRANLRLVATQPWRRERLRANVARFREAARARGIALAGAAADSPIQPILLGDAATAVTVSEALYAAGYRVAAIRPPTVPAGSARLRVTLSAAHEPEQIDGLVAALAHACEAAAA